MHSQGTRDSGWERDEVEGVCWIWEAGPWVRGCAWKGLVLGGGAHWEMVSAGGWRGSGDREVVLMWEVGPLGRDSGTQTSAPKNLVSAIRDLVSPNGVGKDSPMDPQVVFRVPGDS